MKKQRIIIICLLLVLCFAVLCACENNPEEIDEELVELRTWFFTSGVPNNLIEVKHSDPNAEFQLTADKGAFRFDGEWRQTATINSGELISWQSLGIIEGAYVDVIVTVDDNIVGYAVVKITQREISILDYGAEIVKSVVFPKVDGEYQKVTQEKVEAKIQAAKR